MKVAVRAGRPLHGDACFSLRRELTSHKSIVLFAESLQPARRRQPARLPFPSGCFTPECLSLLLGKI